MAPEKVVKKMMISSMKEIMDARKIVDSGTADEVIVDFQATVEGIYNEGLWGTVTVTKYGYSSTRFPDQFIKWR
jgi:hypothetical protein